MALEEEGGEAVGGFRFVLEVNGAGGAGEGEGEIAGEIVEGALAADGEDFAFAGAEVGESLLGLGLGMDEGGDQAEGFGDVGAGFADAPGGVKVRPAVPSALAFWP